MAKLRNKTIFIIKKIVNGIFGNPQRYFWNMEHFEFFMKPNADLRSAVTVDSAEIESLDAFQEFRNYNERREAI